MHYPSARDIDHLSNVVVKYVPEWFPGAGFKKTAQRIKEFLPPLVNKPFDEMKSIAVGHLSYIH